MRLYVNGCSHTYGTELSLDGDFQSAWPYLLAKKLDANLTNSSKIGVSNFTIYKNTIEDILSLNQKPDLAIIQWTHFERFDTPLGLREQKNIVLNKGEDALTRNYRTHYPYEGKMKEPWNKDFYVNFYDLKNSIHIQYMEEVSLFYMYMLQSFLSAKRINFIFLNFNKNRKVARAFTSSTGEGFKRRLNKENWLHNIDTSMIDIFTSHNYQLCRKPKKEPDGRIFPDDHFMKDSHEFLCEAILDFYHLKEKLLMNNRNIRNRQRDFLHFYGDDM